MLGYAGVHRRGDGDYVAAICTAIVPQRRWDENSATWTETGEDRLTLVTFDGGPPRYVEGVKRDDFRDEIGSFDTPAQEPVAATHADLNRPPVTTDVSSPVLATGVQPTDVPDPTTVGTIGFPEPAPDASPAATPQPGGETTTTPVPVDPSGVATPVVPPAQESAPTTENQSPTGSLPPTTP